LDVRAPSGRIIPRRQTAQCRPNRRPHHRFSDTDGDCGPSGTSPARRLCGCPLRCCQMRAWLAARSAACVTRRQWRAV